MCRNSEESRKAVWGYTFDEILEILQLLRWANLQTSTGEPPDATIDALFGERPVSQAMAHHLHQLLPVKIECIFGKRGGGSDHSGKEMLANSKLGARWWEPMKAFADQSVEDQTVLRVLLNRLEKNRHRLIAHREGKTADVTQEVSAKGQSSIVFKANPEIITGVELEELRKYFTACKFFCEHAKDNESGPSLQQFELSAWNAMNENRNKY